MTIRYAVVSHPGKVRPGNEDNFRINSFYRKDVTVHEVSQSGKAKPSRFLAAVCDGMGGEADGETASLLAVEGLLPRSLRELPACALEDIQAANLRLCRHITQQGGTRCGSTLAALYIDGGRAVCCNVGDSRIYLFRNGQLTQLTKDHSQGQQMVDMGILTPEKARDSSARHKLTQHLGIFEEEMVIEPWVAPSVALACGDRFLLCSDGLTDMVPDTEIARILSGPGSSREQAHRLLEQALGAGGRDNITVLLLHTVLW